MNTHEHLLTCLMEECAEVAQRASKALRFGLKEIQQGQPLTNAQRVMGEMNDIIAVVEMLQTIGDLPGPDRALINVKKQKLQRWMNYAQECGTLKNMESPHP